LAGLTIKLENTYRYPQSLCNISSSFVQKNPKQILKKVRSTKPDVTEPVRIVEVDDEGKIRAAVAKRIQEIAEMLSDGKPTSVLILGLYYKER